MFDLKKAAKRIKEDGLYTFIYNEMKEYAGREELTEEEILLLFQKNPKFLEDYKTLNTQSEISNIQLIEQEVLPDDTPECAKLKQQLNHYRKELIRLEPYEGKPDSMVYAIWIGSAVVFLIFVIHNLIVLYTYWYEKYPYLVYLSYLVVAVGGYIYYRKRIKDHLKYHAVFKEVEEKTKQLIERGRSSGCLKKIFQ
ncbi:MAG: hypothetical protein GXN94_05230 [Aquificae bacterium]|nr:hypothetical protein [Aquificota bacterium]